MQWIVQHSSLWLLGCFHWLYNILYQTRIFGAILLSQNRANLRTWWVWWPMDMNYYYRIASYWMGIFYLNIGPSTYFRLIKKKILSQVALIKISMSRYVRLQFDKMMWALIKMLTKQKKINKSILPTKAQVFYKAQQGVWQLPKPRLSWPEALAIWGHVRRLVHKRRLSLLKPLNFKHWLALPHSLDLFWGMGF